MIRLVAVELQRLRHRAVFWLAPVAIILIALAALFGVHDQAQSVDRDRAMAQQWYEEELAHWEQFAETDAQSCLEQQAREREAWDDPNLDLGCETMLQEPRFEDFLPSMDGVYEQYRQVLGLLIYPFLFVTLAVGSTHVAAEYSHRTLGTWLTFVPRRGPVLLSKLLAPALAAVPLVGTGMALLLAGVPLLMRYHGIDLGLTDANWIDVLWFTARIIGLGMVAGAGGAALAFLLRHSGAVIGLVVGYLALAEGMLVGFAQGAQQYLLGNTIRAVALDGATWHEWPNPCVGMCEPIEHEISLAHGATVIGVVIALVVLLAALRFWRADVD